MRFERAFQPEEGTIRLVRLFVGDSLSGVAAADDVALAASELATNVVRHAETPFTVQITNEANRIRLEVSDGSSIIPAVEDLAGHLCRHGRKPPALRGTARSTHPRIRGVWLRGPAPSFPRGRRVPGGICDRRRRGTAGSEPRFPRLGPGLCRQRRRPSLPGHPTLR